MTTGFPIPVAMTLAALFVIATGAYGGCDEKNRSGYIYVYASCTQDRVTSPENICEVSRDVIKIKNVLFISEVVHDANDGRFPSNRFFDETQIQHNISMNGSDSFCYETRSEAEDNRRAQIADYKREDYVIRRVNMRDD